MPEAITLVGPRGNIAEDGRRRYERRPVAPAERGHPRSSAGRRSRAAAAPSSTSRATTAAVSWRPYSYMQPRPSQNITKRRLSPQSHAPWTMSPAPANPRGGLGTAANEHRSSHWCSGVSVQSMVPPLTYSVATHGRPHTSISSDIRHPAGGSLAKVAVSSSTLKASISRADVSGRTYTLPSRLKELGSGLAPPNLQGITASLRGCSGGRRRRRPTGPPLARRRRESPARTGAPCTPWC